MELVQRFLQIQVFGWFQQIRQMRLGALSPLTVPSFSAWPQDNAHLPR